MKNKKILKLSIVGRTNAGKSTLINTLIGETISIQNKKINTTKDLIIGIKNYDNLQLIFYDTPGSNFLKSIHIDQKHLKINLWQGIDHSDLIIYLVDSKNIRINYLISQLKKLSELNKKIIITFNKIDLISQKNLLPIIDKIKKELNIDSYFAVSAKFDRGINDLLKYISKFANNSNWIFNNDEISNKDDVYITNECTRNALLTFLHKEIPYNITIVNKTYKYLKNGDLKIKQLLKINELRYKKIILGKNGEKIKLIREFSQKEISKILKIKTHLYIEIMKA